MQTHKTKTTFYKMWFYDISKIHSLALGTNRTALPSERLVDTLGEIGTLEPDLLAVHLDSVDTFAFVGRIDARATHEHNPLARLRRIRSGTDLAVPVPLRRPVGVPESATFRICEHPLAQRPRDLIQYAPMSSFDSGSS